LVLQVFFELRSQADRIFALRQFQWAERRENFATPTYLFDPSRMPHVNSFWILLIDEVVEKIKAGCLFG